MRKEWGPHKDGEGGTHPTANYQSTRAIDSALSHTRHTRTAAARAGYRRGRRGTPGRACGCVSAMASAPRALGVHAPYGADKPVSPPPHRPRPLGAAPAARPLSLRIRRRRTAPWVQKPSSGLR